MNLLGLALVWLGLAGGVFCKLIVFSNESVWFGIGLALVLALIWAWFCFGCVLAWLWFLLGLAAVSLWFGIG